MTSIHSASPRDPLQRVKNSIEPSPPAEICIWPSEKRNHFPIFIQRIASDRRQLVRDIFPTTQFAAPSSARKLLRGVSRRAILGKKRNLLEPTLKLAIAAALVTEACIQLGKRVLSEFTVATSR
ncbi:MAG TPA: hypothetical protein VF306_22060 [Pirellulales bacterium]